MYAQSDKELSLQTGEVITVTCKHDDGWWEGRTHGEDSHSGFFPKAYVKPKEDEAPKLPPRPNFLAEAANPSAAAPSSSSPSDPDRRSTSEAQKRASEVSGHLDFDSSVATGEPFSLTSLDAFDELMGRGFALDVTKPGEGEVVAAGARVKLQFKAKTWDGAATVVHVFSEGTCAFTLGRGDNLPSGLMRAVALLSVGSAATLTCAPHEAYGEAGNPPFVKPNSHVVFELNLLSASLTHEDVVMEPDGPQPLFCSQQGGARHKQTAMGEPRVKSVVFDSTPVDDALIASAVASGLNIGSSEGEK